MKTIWRTSGERRLATGRGAMRSRRPVLAPERLEPRALLAVTVPPSIASDTVELDDNVLVGTGGGAIEATAGYVQIFGNSRGRIDRVADSTAADLLLKAQTAITVTGAVGAVTPLDTLTLQSVGGQSVNLQQSVTLLEDLVVTKSGAFTIGSTVDVGGDLTIAEATTVTFAGNVTVAGDLTITSATSVTFAGTLTVGGTLTIANATGTTRFTGDVVVGGAAVTSTTMVQVLAGFTTDAGAAPADVTFTTNQVGFATATFQPAAGTDGATLTIRPRTASSALTIASPPGVPAGLNITDADITAIQPGWKRVVFGDEAAGTGAVRVGSIGSQYGGFSQLLNTTTIAGGTIDVVQPVDVTPLASYLEFVARGTGAGGGRLTVSAPINQTEGERSDWLRLTSAGAIEINAPVWATQTISLTSTAGGTIAQGGTAAAITAPALAVDADGAVRLVDSGNAIARVAIKTTNDAVVLREDSGYTIEQVKMVDGARDTKQTFTTTGIDAGTGTVRLVTISGATSATVGQAQAILAGGLGLEGAGTDWSLSLGTNDVATLAADTGAVSFRDVDDLTIGTVAEVEPRAELSGVAVARTADVAAGTTLSITAAGDIVSAAADGTAVKLAAPSGISTAGDVTTAGGNVDFDHATTLTGDVVLDVVDGAAVGVVTLAAVVQGTTAGQQSLTVTGDLDASGSIGVATALGSLAVSGVSTLAGGITLRTTGGQTYSGAAASTGTVTVQAGQGAAVRFLGDTTLGGLVTATADAADYALELAGAKTTITAPVTFANTGTVTLGDGAADALTFDGGLASTAAVMTRLAGSIATSADAATFGAAELTAATILSTGSGNVAFTGGLDGGHALVVNSTGDTTFGGAVGGTTPLASLRTDAGGTTRIDGGGVTTATPTVTLAAAGAGASTVVSSGQFYGDAVVLGAKAVLQAGGGLTAAVAIDADGITFAGTVDGAHALVVNTAGTTTFGGVVGGTTALASLATDAGGTTRVTTATVKTAGTQTYGDAVSFEEPPAPAGVSATSLPPIPPETLMAGSTVSLRQGLTAAGRSLRIDGDAVLGDQPGASLPTTDPASFIDPVIGLNGLRVTGSTTINTNVVFSGVTAPTNPISFQGAVTLASNVLIGGASVVFQSSVSGPARSLAVTAVAFGTPSSVVFDGDVGTALAPLGPIAVTCPGGAVTINAVIHSTGPVVVQGSTIDGDADHAIRTQGGTISLAAAAGIGGTTPIAIEAASVTATTAAGDLRLRGIGDLVVGTPGLSAGGVVSLDASGAIRVPTGGTIAGGDVVTTKAIHWSVLGTADSGAGSLRQVLTNLNAVGDCNPSGTDAVIVVDVMQPAVVQPAVVPTPPTVFQLATQLPDIGAAVTIDGAAGGLVLDGGRTVSSGLVFREAAAGSVLRGVTLRNFTGYGVQLVGARSVVVDTIVVQSLNTSTSMGLYATGDLAGTQVLGSTFSGGLRGALLDQARNLAFGLVGRGNTLANNRAAPRQPTFAGTGIRAQGDCAGTVVSGNLFTQNNFGFAFIAARNLALTGNSFTRNSSAGIFIEGNSAGSTQSGNTFGSRGDRNKTNLLRAKRSIFGGP